MKAFVTGSNGMIGTAVLASAPSTLRELRAQVGPDRPEPGPLTDGHPTVVCDITDADALRPLAAGADVIIHLAGPPSVARSFAEPVAFLQAHAVGTTTVVELCQELAIPRLVHVSSAEVYGRPERNPVDEGAALAPRSPYGAAKVAAESVIGAAARSGGLDAVILRPFSVYGPGTRPDSVLGRILGQALDGDAIRLRSLDGIRDYCFVDDLADAVWRAATADLDGVRTCNIASGTGTSAGDLARSTLTARDGALPAGATVEADPGPEGARPAAADISELVADVRRAELELGWRATTSLVDGLRRTLDWCSSTAARR